MQAWFSFIRTTFLVLGVLEILSAVTLAVKAIFHPPRAEFAIPVWFLFLFCGLVAGVGGWSCLASRMMGKGESRAARLVVCLNSLLHLIAFPFGTVVGCFGLYWCWSERARRTQLDDGEFSHEPEAGDGVHPLVQKAAGVIGIGLWVIAFEATDWWGAAHALPQRPATGGLLLVIGCNLVHVFFHELGHAVAGWASDMKLSSFAAGPLLGEKRGGRWRLRFSLLGLLAGGGSVSMSPLNLRDLRSRMVFHVAGGPAASLLIAAGSFTCLLLVPGSQYEPWWELPAVLAAVSGSTLLFNLIPFGAAAGFSDGAALVQLVRGGRFARYREALMMVAATTVSNVRPGDLDAGMLASGLRCGHGEKAVLVQFIEVLCAIDRKDMDLARERLEVCLAQIDKPELFDDPACLAEIAFYVAFVTGDIGRAQYWLGKAEHAAALRRIPIGGEFDYWKAVAIVRQGQGRAEEAEEAWRHTFAMAQDRPRYGLYQFEYETLRSVRDGAWIAPQGGPVKGPLAGATP